MQLISSLASNPHLYLSVTPTSKFYHAFKSSRSDRSSETRLSAPTLLFRLTFFWCVSLLVCLDSGIRGKCAYTISCFIRMAAGMPEFLPLTAVKIAVCFFSKIAH
ncbi:hypothetical protein BU23DRAFT_288675 [Bimuria novae-zelandiae CBS 107.79]|uniref:Uncharacterized protein n=1 Tax=Bimuria novae-zelandiae CBS 107.79 TaxID=1447943 RepID=A0A6A5UUK1_9PLEO|nr:hypothetical protein BU23DRAFT_288675 [Bimuria novae-zelandiae CBS 107.79]